MRLLTSVLSRPKIAKIFTTEEGQVAFENAQRDIVTLFPVISYLQDSFATSSTSFVGTPLAVDVQAGKVYVLEAILAAQSALVTNGLGLSLSIPAGGEVIGEYSANITANTNESNYNNASGVSSGNISAVPVANTNIPVIGKWLIKTMDAGNVVLNLRSEAGSQVMLMGGLCVLRLTQVV